MPKETVDMRLTRLLTSGLCKGDPSKYAMELKQLANKVARIGKVEEKKEKIFKALADTTRLRILKLLKVREMCVCEIMIALDLTQPTTSHHLKILENAGLIKRRKKGKWVFYNRKDLKRLEIN
ncbi:MAG: metalloregulator ArsR/SmtB family transcription factor [Nitrososphaeria archaeon]